MKKNFETTEKKEPSIACIASMDSGYCRPVVVEKPESDKAEWSDAPVEANTELNDGDDRRMYQQKVKRTHTQTSFRFTFAKKVCY